MPIACRHPPIIIMGMARSGTTLLAELLTDLGLYLGGERVQEDLEAYYFFRANRKIFLQVHGYSDNPFPMRYFYRNQEAIDDTARSLEADARSWRIVKFLGWKRYFQYGSLERFAEPWGWKDPRNVFTLPLWLRVFPQAKIVYIVRNGVDVASSLRKMEERDIKKRQIQSSKLTAILKGKSALERFGFRGAVRHLYLDGGFSLWEEYVEQAEHVLAETKQDTFSIRYEELLSDPMQYLPGLRDFCELTGRTNTSLERLAEKVRNERAFAFVRDPELLQFYSSKKNTAWMTRLGYSSVSI